MTQDTIKHTLLILGMCDRKVHTNIYTLGKENYKLDSFCAWKI